LKGNQQAGGGKGRENTPYAAEKPILSNLCFAFNLIVRDFMRQ
jgi:hypothetical protein